MNIACGSQRFHVRAENAQNPRRWWRCDERLQLPRLCSRSFLSIALGVGRRMNSHSSTRGQISPCKHPGSSLSLRQGFSTPVNSLTIELPSVLTIFSAYLPYSTPYIMPARATTLYQTIPNPSGQKNHTLVQTK